MNKLIVGLGAAFAFSLLACGNSAADPAAKGGPASTPTTQPAPQKMADEDHEGSPEVPNVAPEGLAIATFAGGCFWCMEGSFEHLGDGIVAVVSGYTAGHVPHATYHQVGSGTTGHAEAIRVVYDPKKISYPKLLDAFWHNVDPTQADGQFCDHGSQYRTGIYVHDAEQRTQAEASKVALEASRKLPARIVTEIADATAFYAAEPYHQDFYKTNASHYQRYRSGCGRDARLESLWGESAGH